MPDAASAPIATLERLVAFDTVSSNSNAALIDWAAERLESAGAKVFVQHAPEAGKANLFATIGPHDVPGLQAAIRQAREALRAVPPAAAGQ